MSPEPPTERAFTHADRVPEDPRTSGLESLTRPLLRALVAVTALDSAYLTRIDWDGDVQHILYSRNDGAINVAEGLVVPWEDTLCKRALESRQPCTSNVAEVWGDSDAARDLGIQTYVSVPVILADGHVFGTLCVAGGTSRPLDDDAEALLDVFAGLIADQIARSQELHSAREQVMLAEARREEQALFAAAAQHGLKGPVSIIRGWLEMLLDAPERLDDSQRRIALESMRRTGDALARAVDDLLLVARSDNLAATIDPGPTDVASFVEEVVQDLSAVSPDHQVAARVEVPRDLRGLLDADAVRTVIEHLVENAVKHTPDGRVSVAVAQESAGHLVICVEDDGPGIPTDVDLFAPFVRGGGDVAGAGLGLFVVRSLVQALGGEVSADRRPEGGSVFRLVLPFATSG